MTVRKVYQFLPNALTLGNLLCGVISIMMGAVELAFSLFVLGLVFDLLDGWTARWLGATSDIGIQLDSLADLVSFGVVPAWYAYQLYAPSLGSKGLFLALVPLAAAYRLARFNTEHSAEAFFTGLPSPAAGVFVISVVFLDQYFEESFINYCNNFGFFLFLVLFPALAMVSRQSLPSFKSGQKAALAIILPIFLQLFLSYWSPIFLITIVPVYYISGWFRVFWDASTSFSNK